MQSTYLVTGATGAIGYAFTMAILNNNEKAIILVRNYRDAVELFGYHHNLTIVEGDVFDTDLLHRLALQSQFVMHAVNAPFSQWATFLPAATESIINACANLNITILFPGNNYGFGDNKLPISEITPNNPCTHLGRVRVEIESMLQKAAESNKFQVLNIRLPEIWGPNVTNAAFAPIFEAAISLKPLPWIFDADTPQQLMYSLDAGRLIFELTKIAHEEPYTVFHAAGTEISSVRNWLTRIGSLLGSFKGISSPPKLILQVYSRINPTIKNALSLSYKWQTSIRFDDKKLRQALPGFTQTPMDEAINQTALWFKCRVDKNITRRKTNFKTGAKEFIMENVAIGFFPFILALVGSLIPFVNSQAAMFGVVAGIYWTSPLKALLRKGIPYLHS